MSKMAETLMVAAMIPDIPVGSEFQTWPLHMTVAPWFTMPCRLWGRFDDGMQEIIEETCAPMIEGGSADQFGSPNGRLDVRRLDVPTRTFNLINGFNIHADVIGLAKTFGNIENDEYTGLNWKPHVTNTADSVLCEGEVVQITGLTVVKKDHERRIKIVKALYCWGDLK